ncbi:hypothetical protein DERP_003140 [Dermatophagoides pteronyssinus]|uniref:Uncharacterized protein n=1 Tax=Dermatophagoides pteronyssinus TaxID=6956 RepID=A0ABQ8JIM3_DERPT|nr:hypothetical protein DERP_003140 [Dermatophagoides pteronyssinus]
MPSKVSFIEPNNNCLSSSTKRVKIIQNSTILSPSTTSTTKSIISNPPSTTATTLATLNEEDGDEI